MGYHNMFAREQLLEIAKELHIQMESLKSTTDEFGELDEIDREFRYGARKGIQLAIDAIYAQVEALEKQK